ncbi:MAG TPA: DciA family protein [Usitatibacter sp.]|nr:DciA family protein [Usitatibacter sp.]HXS53541.1 DciA family protein [Usitatibacter sp.]
MASEPISKHLASAELHDIAARLAYIKRLQRRYRTLVPETLAEASRVCAIDGTTIVICAASGPVAAILRQLAPRVLEGLREAARKSSKHSTDQEFNGIRVEVQVKQVTSRRPIKAREPLPREKLEAVARDLSESPLRSALERITGKR